MIPFRPVARVPIHPYANIFTLNVLIEKDDDDTVIDVSFGNMDEAAYFAGTILRRSYVGSLKVTYVRVSCAFAGKKEAVEILLFWLFLRLNGDTPQTFLVGCLIETHDVFPMPLENAYRRHPQWGRSTPSIQRVRFQRA